MDNKNERHPIPKALEIVKHPIPKEVYVLCGVRFLFSYSILHLALFAFTFTYVNILTLYEFTVYSSLMTGNFLNAALEFEAKLYMDVLFRFSLIVACTTIGTAVDCYLLTHIDSRRNVFAVLMLMFVASVVLVDVVSDSTGRPGGRYSLTLLCITSGALVHWSQKLGYICSAMTGNMFKIAEIIFNFLSGYDVGGPKMHGEALIYVAIFTSSVTGALSAVYMLKHSELVALYPLLTTVPLHLYLAGCFEEWGFLSRAGTASDSASSSEVELGGIVSPIQGNSSETTDSSQRDSTSERPSTVLFEVCRISDAEIKDVKEIESGYAYRRDKAMFYDD